MGRSRLEEEIEAATRQFVSKLVEIIRSVSIAEVAALGAEPSKPRRPTTSVVGKPPQRRASAPGGSDLKERALATIRDAGRPIAAKSIADALSDIERREGQRPRVYTTAARSSHAAVAYDVAAAELRARTGPALLVFGTGHGLADSVIALADVHLAPVRPVGYNHLAVRAAVSIILDRLFGDAGA